MSVLLNLACSAKKHHVLVCFTLLVSLRWMSLLASSWCHKDVEFAMDVSISLAPPQEAVISPLLANIYLHYVLDLWAHQWRKRHARGECYIVRYADGSVFGFALIF
jgi:hypothetical protein